MFDNYMQSNVLPPLRNPTVTSHPYEQKWANQFLPLERAHESMLKECNLHNLVLYLLIHFLPIQAITVHEGDKAKLKCHG